MAECIANVTVTSFNRLQSTVACITALKQTRCPGWHLTVVDNNSVDGSVAYLQELYNDGVIDSLLLCKRNVGVAVAANLGWAAVPALYYVKLDNDVEVLRDDWLTTLIETAQSHPDAGCVGYYIEDSWPGLKADDGCFAVEYSVGSCVLIPQATHVKTVKKRPSFYILISKTAQYEYDKKHSAIEQYGPEYAQSLSNAQHAWVSRVPHRE